MKTAHKEDPWQMQNKSVCLMLESNPNEAKVTLDKVIKTMWETAQDMNVKYKETSEGGLAINIPVSLPEC